MTEAAQPEVNKNPIVTLTLPVDAVNIVMASLAKQPFEAVADLITAIRSQAIEQLQKQEGVQQLPTTPVAN